MVFFVNNVLRQIFLNVVNLFQILHAGTKIGQKQIGDRERSHGLHHDNGARYDNRIMASFDLDLRLLCLPFAAWKQWKVSALSLRGR